MTDVLVKNAQEFQRWGKAELQKDWPKRITVKRGRTRSAEQNRYLWGVVYPELLGQTGLKEQGWQNDDIHEYLLGECFGWHTLEGLGQKRKKPNNRSSNLNKQEFTDYVAFIQQFAAQHGAFIPDPE